MLRRVEGPGDSGRGPEGTSQVGGSGRGGVRGRCDQKESRREPVGERGVGGKGVRGFGEVWKEWGGSGVSPKSVY